MCAPTSGAATWHGGMTWAGFLGWVCSSLSPLLRADDVAVMHNLSTHRAAGVAETIGGRGARAVYLLHCSPDLNPIEKMWSKMKTLFRRERVCESGVVARALSRVTPSDCVGWYRSCGCAAP